MNPTILSIALVAMDILSWATFIVQGSMFLSFLGYTAIINQVNFGSMSVEVRTMHMLQQMVGTLGPYMVNYLTPMLAYYIYVPAAFSSYKRL